MKQLSISISRNVLLIIYKSIVKPHLDHCDIIYDQPCSHFIKEKLEKVQYNASSVITC